ncbi:hypothetical protein D3C86_2268710 [compost metagenome]
MLRQITHFGGDDGKAAPGFPSARGFHGRIEGQDIGLEGDTINHADDVDNLAVVF